MIEDEIEELKKRLERLEEKLDQYPKRIGIHRRKVPPNSCLNQPKSRWVRRRRYNV